MKGLSMNNLAMANQWQRSSTNRMGNMLTGHEGKEDNDPVPLLKDAILSIETVEQEASADLLESILSKSGTIPENYKEYVPMSGN